MRERVAERDLARQIQRCEMIYYVTHPDGRKERLVNRFSMRHFYRYEAEHLLARCGFQLETVLADYDGTPYEEMRKELILVARR